MNRPISADKKEKLQVIDWLVEHFPKAFFKKAHEVKPLKIGTMDDIIDFYDRLEMPPFSKKNLKKALSYYSTSPSYLSCQKANCERVDIYGNVVDTVTAEQADYAKLRYQERYVEKKKEKNESSLSSQT